ncbi:MAG: class I SAM-dependent methyltransferase [Candidatus Omnitrophica bacterium]|nr:class I SAM-dependent methyltransferase [Candidatus Omnitrophota bacterium]
MDKEKEVNPDLYNRSYYLIDNEGYREYAEGLESHIHHKFSRVLEITQPSKGDNILDVGCGRGELIYYCAQRGANVFGIDYSKAAIEIAKQTIKKLPEELQYLAKAEIGDIVKYSFQEKYDIIFMVDIVEHMHDWQLREVFKKITGILNDRGRLIITTPNYYYDKYLFYIKRIFDVPSNISKWSLRILRGKYKPKNLAEYLHKIFKLKINRDSIESMHVNLLSPPGLKGLLKEFDTNIRCEDHSKNPISLITKKWWGREIVAIAKKRKD